MLTAESLFSKVPGY